MECEIVSLFVFAFVTTSQYDTQYPDGAILRLQSLFQPLSRGICKFDRHPFVWYLAVYFLPGLPYVQDRILLPGEAGRASGL